MSDPAAILVAGGAGYIGSHTAQALRLAGFLPVVLDNLVTGNRFSVQFGPFYEASIDDAACIAGLAEKYRIQGAILFAAHAYVGESTAQPRKYYRNNVCRSLAFYDALLQSGIRSVVFSSSCSIYGTQPHQDPISEETPKNPLSPYAESKWIGEQMLQWLDKSDGLRSACLRYFNAAGADPAGVLGEFHRPETHLIPLAIYAALGGTPLRVFGTDYPTPDGTAIRDYIHVTDLAQAHVLALRRLIEGSPSFQCNLGTGSGSSIRQVLAEVERRAGRPVPAEFCPRREGDAPCLVADPSRAGQLLGWKPQYSALSTIIETAWRWHSEREAAVVHPGQ